MLQSNSPGLGAISTNDSHFPPDRAEYFESAVELSAGVSRTDDGSDACLVLRNRWKSDARRKDALLKQLG